MIPIPTEVSVALDGLQADARKLGVTLIRFTTMEGLGQAEWLALRLAETSKAIRLQVRQMRADEKQRLRDEAKASEQMVAENARIIAQREKAA